MFQAFFRATFEVLREFFVLFLTMCESHGSGRKKKRRCKKMSVKKSTAAIRHPHHDTILALMDQTTSHL